MNNNTLDAEDCDDECHCMIDVDVDVDMEAMEASDNRTESEIDIRTESGSSFNGEDSFRATVNAAAVNRSKSVVLAALVISAILLTGATYYFSSNGESNIFRSQFESFAEEMSRASNSKASQVFTAVESFSFSITSQAMTSDSNWPFVTHPQFETQGRYAAELSGAVFLAFVPIVSEVNREEWGNYSSSHQGWIKDGLLIQNGDEPTEEDAPFDAIYENIYTVDENYQVDGLVNPVDLYGKEYYAPVWQMSPAMEDTSYVNFDLLSNPLIPYFYEGMMEVKEPVISSIFPFGQSVNFLEHIRQTTANSSLTRKLMYEDRHLSDNDFPHSMLFVPVFQNANDELNVVGAVIAVLSWDRYFAEIFTENVDGVDVVVNDSCGNEYSFRVNGTEVLFVGLGDIHEQRYDEFVHVTKLAPSASYRSSTFSSCDYELRIYPSEEFASTYQTNLPIIYTIVVATTLLFTICLFIFYDYRLRRRQKKVIGSALQANQIIASLFPSTVRDRLLSQPVPETKPKPKTKPKASKGSSSKGGTSKGKKLANLKAKSFKAARLELKTFLDGHGRATKEAKIQTSTIVGAAFEGKPIADLFPRCTVMFSDISGFTSWSSEREPSQVFTLLETAYCAFDRVAKGRRVFKVETIGDCYVAVAGLPEPREDHAVVMAMFARDCMERMTDVVKNLEVSLGPGTQDLKLRFGLNSGPVTAGVLRGEKSRFQLFGDTVNTASRMESTGEPNRIQVSDETGRLLADAGKSHWLTPRTELIPIKGKGNLRTYWLDFGKKSEKKTAEDGATDTLSRWNADLLISHLKHIVARRNAARPKLSRRRSFMKQQTVSTVSTMNLSDNTSDDTGFRSFGNALDEVEEVINLPKFDHKVISRQEDPNLIKLSDEVVRQVNDYVAQIGTMYHKTNPFHNFSHASHVTMSVSKLLSRIVAPDIVSDDDSHHSHTFASQLHDHTYGITSDPLTQFAVIFSAIIHDVDHPGVPNSQLIVEKDSAAKLYKEKSIAEQKSIDIAWDLLMEDAYSEFRNVLASTETELRRFRQIVVNSVIATDIMDKDQRKFRDNRWYKAFNENTDEKTSETSSVKSGLDYESTDLIDQDINRKATIVIEHIIQASDVAHTMQHWHVYRKWNGLLFREMYRAYRNGRAEKDPSDSWYEGEIGFFDFYIIPLAKKLKECGVFGVSSDEYLQYATKNRAEWKAKGKDIVQQMVQEVLGENSSCKPVETKERSKIKAKPSRFGRRMTAMQ